jgi:hypothetical protein
MEARQERIRNKCAAVTFTPSSKAKIVKIDIIFVRVHNTLDCHIQCKSGTSEWLNQTKTETLPF